jgi:Glyoxalase-like domain
MTVARRQYETTWCRSGNGARQVRRPSSDRPVRLRRPRAALRAGICAQARFGSMTAPAERPPLATLECVVLDCPDLGRLAAFYRSLLGGSINQPDPRWNVGDRWATPHTPAGQVLAFQAVDHYVPPRWPDPAHPQQLHLGFHVEAIEQAHPRILAMGGRLLVSARGWRSTPTPPVIRSASSEPSAPQGNRELSRPAPPPGPAPGNESTACVVSGSSRLRR